MTDGQKKFAAGGLFTVALVYGGYTLWNREPADTLAQKRSLMDVETQQVVDVPFREPWPAYPHKSPKTGKMTLYPFETCYNGPCGKAGGTRVILQEQLGKPGPTLCPKCGHVVRIFNPGPRAESSAPAEGPSDDRSR